MTSNSAAGAFSGHRFANVRAHARSGSAHRQPAGENWVIWATSVKPSRR